MVAKQATVYIVKPEGFDYAEAFRDAATALAWNLQSLGWFTCVSTDGPCPGTLNIYLHWNNMHGFGMRPLPDSVIYNLEYLSREANPYYAPLPGRLADFARTCHVWDYCDANQAFAARELGVMSSVVPVPYAPVLDRPPGTTSQDIDVLFYGTLPPRRQDAIDRLRAAGLNVHTAWRVWGADREALIARAKVVLSMHYLPRHPFEDVRVVPLLARRKAVLAEIDGGWISDDMRAAVAGCTLADMPDMARYLAGNASERRALEETGYAVVSRRNIRPALRQALERIVGP